MSISRDDFAKRNQTEGERNVTDVIEKVLTNSQQQQVKQTAIFNDVMHEMTMAIKDAKATQTPESEKMSIELQKIFQSSQGKTSQLELANMLKKVSDIENVLSHSDNVVDVELEQMTNLVNLTRERLKEDRMNLATMGALKDAVDYTIDNAVDITAVATGLFTNSPLVTFMAKSIGDMGKSFKDKRREVQQEKQTRLAEQLNEHQQKAYDQREETAKETEKNNSHDEKTKDEPRPVIVRDGNTVPVEIIAPDMPSLEPLDVNATVPLERIESESESDSIRQLDDQNQVTPNEDNVMTSILNEHKLTNTLLDKFVSFMLADSIDSLEEDKENKARDEKLFRVFSKKDKPKLAKKGGFLSSLFENIPGIAMMTPLLASIGTFFTVTLIPALGTFFTAVSALALPILAGIAVISAVAGFLDGFYNAEEILGKTDVSIVERFASGIGGILETVAGIGDFLAGILGFDIDMAGWINKNITRPFASFMDSLNLEELFTDVTDVIFFIPKKIIEGLEWVKDKLDISGHIKNITTKATDALKQIDFVDLLLGPFDEIYHYLNGKFNIVDRVKAIFADFDLANIIEGIKNSILTYIPDFLLSDEQEQKKASLDPEYKAQREKDQIKEESHDFVSKKLRDDDVVDYNRYGDSKVIDWSSVEKLNAQNLKMMVEFDDWDEKTKKRLIDLSVTANEKQVPEVKETEKIQPKLTEGQNDNDLERKYKIDWPEPVEAEKTPINIEIAPPTQQPLIAHRSNQTSTIDAYQNMIEQAEKVKQDMPAMPVVNQSQQVTSHATYNVAAVPYNLEPGVRSMQKAFAA